jgi:hypothetical protein
MRRWLAMGVGALLFMGAGCATTHDARRELLARASAEVAYDVPPKELLEAARAVLSDQGYVLAPSRSSLALRTLWKIDGNPDFASRWSLVLVMVEQRADGRCVVRTQQATHTTVGRAASHPSFSGGQADGKNGKEGGSTSYVAGEPLSAAKPVFSRALDLEWEILTRVAPRFAANVEKQVDIYLASQPH